MINEQGHIVLDADGSKVLKTIKQIDSETRSLKATLRNLEINSDSFKKTTTAIQELNREKVKLNQTLSGTNKMWENIKSQMISVGAVALGFLGFQFLTNQIGGMIRKNAELSDSLATIRQKTGMTQEEVEKLNKAFGKFDTRTATKELRAIATELGALGINKDKIADTTKAIDKLSVALEGEFANASEVTRVTGTLRNILTDIKTDAPDQDMLHLGNALLELGNAGLATAPVVSDIATRIGAVGGAMGLTAGQVLGISASLQELGLTAERGGTATAKILQKMTANVGEFAKIAGVPVQEFTKMLNTDLYGAFKQVMEGSQKSTESATALAMMLKDAELSGAGASEVFLKLGKNAGLMDEKVQLASKALGETSKIMDAFDLKNETLGAKLDKLGKSIYGIMANSGITKFFESMVDGLLQITDKTTKADKAVKEFNDATRKYEETSKKITPLLDTIDALQSKTILSKDEQQKLKDAIIEVGNIMPNAATSFDSFGNAIAISTTKAREFLEVQKSIAREKNKEAIKAKEAEISDKMVELLRTNRRIFNYQEDSKFKDTSFGGGVMGTGSTVKGSTLEELEKWRSDAQRLNQELIDAKNYLAELKGETIPILNNGTAQSTETPEQKAARLKKEAEAAAMANTKAIEEAQKKLQDYLSDTAKLTKDLRTAHAQSIDDDTQREVELARVRYENNLDDLKQYEATIIAKRKAGIPLTEEEKKREAVLTELKLQLLEEYQRKAKDVIDTFNKKLAEDEFRKTVESLENTQAARRNALKKQYADGKIDKKTYDAAIQQLEIQDLEERKIAYADYGKDVTDIDEKITDKKIANIDRVAKANEKAVKDWKEFLKETERQFSMWSSATQDIVGGINDLAQSKDEETYNAAKKNSDSSIERARSQSAERLRILDLEYQKGYMTKEQYDNAKAVSEQQLADTINGLNEDINKKARKMAYEKAIRDKNMAMFNAAIYGALAIIKAFAENAILGAATTVAVGLQLAAINARPLPEYAVGGKTKVTGNSGQSYNADYVGSISNGGAYSSPSLGILGEKGYEYVVPNWIATMPEMANVMGLLEAVRVRGYAGGGATTAAANAAVAGNSGDANTMLTMAVLKLVSILDGGVEAKLSYDQLMYDLNKIDSALNSGKIRSATP